MNRDTNGNSVVKDIRKEEKGWGVNVWCGSGVVTNVRRYYYKTRRQAQAGDISDGIGERGKIA